MYITTGFVNRFSIAYYNSTRRSMFPTNEKVNITILYYRLVIHTSNYVIISILLTTFVLCTSIMA